MTDLTELGFSPVVYDHRPKLGDIYTNRTSGVHWLLIREPVRETEFETLWFCQAWNLTKPDFFEWRYNMNYDYQGVVWCRRL